jgi:hypothetical protein
MLAAQADNAAAVATGEFAVSVTIEFGICKVNKCGMTCS